MLCPNLDMYICVVHCELTCIGHNIHQACVFKLNKALPLHKILQHLTSSSASFSSSFTASSDKLIIVLIVVLCFR